MQCIFIQSFWNHLISNLCVCTSHQRLMPLTYCRMRVNVNEKYIIHIPTKPSRSVVAVPGCLTRAQKGKERQSTPTQFLISFIDFFFCLLKWGWGGGCLQLYCTQNLFFSVFQNNLCVASQKPDLGSQYFPTFSFKGCTWITIRKMWRQQGFKFKNVVPARNKR